MLSTAGKGERRNLRGSARLSSKMSGRPPRLRALRSRQQRTRTDADGTRRSEGNLKGVAKSHEEKDQLEESAKRCDEEKKSEDAGRMTDDAMANEMANDGGDDEGDEEVTMTAIDDQEDNDVVDVDIEMRSVEDETIETIANEQQASYECKSCKPPKELPDIKAYFEHLRKEHNYKVRRKDLERRPPGFLVSRPASSWTMSSILRSRVRFYLFIYFLIHFIFAFPCLL